MVSVVMVWEVPAVSQTRIEFWNKPQFTQSGMWWFTLAFGFLGLHHFYLRSPQTGLIFLIVNFISLGYLWAYDLVQLSSSGGYTTETLNKHGLAHPWGALGLAQGMWKEPEKSMFPDVASMMPSSIAPASAPQASAPQASAPQASAPQASAPQASAPQASAPQASAPQASAPQASAPQASAANSGEGVKFKGYNKNGNPRGTMVGGAMVKEEEPPNPIFFLLYALIIPLAPVAQLIAGDTNNAVSRFADLTIIPLGFIFYLLAMLYDYWILFSNPADLLVAGSKRFFPFTYLGMDADSHSPMLTGKSEIKPCPPDSTIKTLLRLSVPIIAYFFPGLGKTIQTALDTKDTIVSTVTTAKEVVIDGGMAKVAQVTDTAVKVGALSTAVTAGVSKSVAKAGAAVANPEALLPQPEITTKVGNLAPAPAPAPVPVPVPVPGPAPVPGPGPGPGPVPASSPAANAQGQGQGQGQGKGQGVNFKEYNANGNPRGTMVGGRRLDKEPMFNTLDYAALGSLGAVIGGGLLLSANRFRNVFSKANDSPPDPRAVREDVQG